MGLDIFVGGNHVARWSYSGFGKFRKKIALEAGIQLGMMEGFHSLKDETVTKLIGEGFEKYAKAMEEDANSQNKMSWDTIRDPIKILLHHSDCDGNIPPEDCSALADRIEELIKDWPDKIKIETDSFWQSHGYLPILELDNYDKTQATSLVAGLRTAALTNFPVEFG